MCVHTHGCSINSMKFYHMYVHVTTTTVKIRTIPAPCWHSCSSSLSISRTPAAAAAKSLQSCPTLCNPIDSSPPGSSVHSSSSGFSRQEYLANINLCSISIILLLKNFNISCYMSYKMLRKCNILSLTFSTQHNLRSIQIVGYINSSFLLSLTLFIYVQNN